MLPNLYLSWLKLDKTEATELPGFCWAMRDSILEFSEWLDSSSHQEIFQNYIGQCIKKRGYLVGSGEEYSLCELFFSYVDLLARSREVAKGSLWSPAKNAHYHINPIPVLEVNENDKGKTVSIKFKNKKLTYQVDEFLAVLSDGRLAFVEVQKQRIKAHHE